jgi:hypothetical protein
VTTATKTTFRWHNEDHEINRGAEVLALITLDGPLAAVFTLLEPPAGGGPPGQPPTLVLSGTIDPDAANPLYGVPGLDLKATVPTTYAVQDPGGALALGDPRIEVATIGASPTEALAAFFA